MRSVFAFFVFACLSVAPIRVAPVWAADPVIIGFDGAYGMKNSTSAQAIEQGVRIAIKEINDAGGVLGGRPLSLVTRDNRSVPARGIQNIHQFAATKDLVAVLGGRFSPVILQELPVIHDERVIMMDAWGSADGITDHDYHPSYTFRVSLKDELAMPTMLRHAAKQGLTKVALFLPNTGWGRSNQKAAQRFAQTNPVPAIVSEIWYNWGDRDFGPKIQEALSKGVQAIVMVANDLEGSVMVKNVAALPRDRRIPIISHWGVTGGKFFDLCDGALGKIDFTVVQTFSLHRADPAIRDRVMALAAQMFGFRDVSAVQSPVGFGHGYDIVHILAKAIDIAGSTDRAAVRDALSKVGTYKGLVRTYDPPFTEDNHNALKLEDVFLARYDANGHIVPVE